MYARGKTPECLDCGKRGSVDTWGRCTLCARSRPRHDRLAGLLRRLGGK